MQRRILTSLGTDVVESELLKVNQLKVIILFQSFSLITLISFVLLFLVGMLSLEIRHYISVCGQSFNSDLDNVILSLINIKTILFILDSSDRNTTRCDKSAKNVFVHFSTARR